MTAASEQSRMGTRAAKRFGLREVEDICRTPVRQPEAFDYVDGVTTPGRPASHCIAFIDRFDERLVQTLAGAAAESLLVIATADYQSCLRQPHVVTPHPRLLFATLVRALFDYERAPQLEAIEKSAQIDPSARISYGVTVGAGSEIGAGTYIYPNVTIGPRVRIGRNCVIKSGTVIGQPGFGIFRDEGGKPHPLPHVGGVVIGDNVGLGALNTVVGGTIHPTVIEDSVKTDDHVHIAHNCHIGARTLITACAELSGSVSIGRDCWIGPNAAIRDGLSVGDGAFIGIAANVIAPVPAGATVYGNPARARD
ncbi:MAG: DapH/DapD/GlmU-related protein [Pseudolabrys sp.]